MIFQAKGAVHLIKKVDNVLDFSLNLLRRHEDMGIILGEVAHTEQAVEGTGQFMAMHQAQLTGTQRQVAIAVLLGLVHQHAARAVHRLDSVVLTVNLSEIHIFLVMSPMTGLLPQLAVQNHRRLDFLIAIAAMYLTPVVNQLVADNHAVWMEEREARAFLMDAEQVKLLAQLAMVALGSLLQHLQISIQLILLLKSSAVYTLQHLVLLAATPVSTCHALQLQCLYLAGGHHMRACAQIRELALSIEGNLRILRQVIYKLYLVILTGCPEHVQSLLTADQLALQLQVLLDNLVHFLLDVLQVILGEALLHVNIIVKAVLNGRADGQLHVLILVQTLNCLCQDM